MNRKLKAAGVVIFAGFILLNGAAFMHAWRFTHYAGGGVRTDSPETLQGLHKLKVLLTGVTLPKPLDIQEPRKFGLVHESVKLTSGDGFDLAGWYIARPAARGTVVMFHGFTLCKSYLLPEAKFLHSRGFNVLLIDFRGSGESQDGPVTFGFKESLDVAAAVTWVRKRNPALPVIAYGRSMGSAAILKAIHDDLIQVDGVILESPFNRYVSTIRNRFRAMNIPPTPFAELLVFWGSVQQGFNGFAFNPVNYASRVSCPALLLHGGADPRVSVYEVKTIAQRIEGPCRFEIITDAGHEPYLQVNRTQYARALDDWINTHFGR